MKKILLMSVLAVALSSCATERYVKYIYVKNDIPIKYLTCPQMKKSDYPADIDAATQDDGSKVLNTTTTKLRTCGVNAKSARDYQAKVNAVIDEKNKLPPVKMK
ncbi:hypothetical protein EVB81_105 [Rhizobium phage RHph_I46]|uniref:Lipoprotein n=1 Tax=Rhizobium phage RHph_I1_9 TaxID=2509729 RepID=A0A7S5R9E1_9CAUD|nr:hypothetical protein PP936_gp104 [Rhizobium phage RHph_I1_9]QIG69674.1 hypothetical protein EVB81_105 [Rhizobium phage RHph_I46]QIG70955.1 hypothetical protein EVB92_105 [Rhizobium phage RHph_I9]QIG73541.1 hypothetical protein EVC04_104 [Rhizobium phage RHph_I1_9]QIG76294.1 hypothetical protein EVC25_105 [Rhizobium phage RHph_I34]